MKLSRVLRTNLLVSIVAGMLTVACNKEEYFAKSIAVEGIDAACASGTDFASCQALPGCQVALEDVESVDPVFAACIANPPDEEVIIPDHSTTPPEQEPSQEEPAQEVPQEQSPPTLEDAIQANCEGLDEDYYYVKTITSDSGAKKKNKKVKICHHKNRSTVDPHAIIIACPALKAHTKNHSDYLGACKVD